LGDAVAPVPRKGQGERRWSMVGALAVVMGALVAMTALAGDRGRPVSREEATWEQVQSSSLARGTQRLEQRGLLRNGDTVRRMGLKTVPASTMMLDGEPDLLVVEKKGTIYCLEPDPCHQCEGEYMWVSRDPKTGPADYRINCVNAPPRDVNEAAKDYLKAANGEQEEDEVDDDSADDNAAQVAAEGGATEETGPVPAEPALESDEGQGDGDKLEAKVEAEQDCDAIEDLDAWFECEDNKRILLGM